MLYGTETNPTRVLIIVVYVL